MKTNSIKRIMVDMSINLIHHGHVRLLEKASELGYVIVGLTTDDEVIKFKGYVPELDYEQRKEIISSIKYVDEVVETGWLITEETLEKYNIDILVHDPEHDFMSKKIKVINFPRTEGISSTILRTRAFRSKVSKKNNQKLMFTPGPSSICSNAVENIEPVFGRNDSKYKEINEKVEKWLLELSGQDDIISLIGSATLAIEISLANFVNKELLVINTGYYSQRLYQIALNYVKADLVEVEDIQKIEKKYEWVAACYTETSTGYKFNINQLKNLKLKTQSKLFLDATGSIGLEDNHELADIIAFSSCKGLLGLTGGSFIAKKEAIKENPNVNLPFYLSYKTHREKLVTGPYHIIHGLYNIKSDHYRFIKNIKSFHQEFLEKNNNFLTWNPENQPVLCTQLNTNIKLKNKNVILYEPRTKKLNHNIICHLHAFDGKSFNDLEKFLTFDKE